MKVTLRNNFANTARAVERGLFLAAGKAAQETADYFGRQSQKAIRGRMVQTRLGKMQGAIRYTSSLKKRTGRSNPNAVSRALTRGDRAWSVVWNVGGSDRSTGAFDSYTARSATIIKPKSGKRWLAFPVPNGPFPKKVGRKKMTPALWNSSGLVNSIGPLVFIKGNKANVAYLVVRNISVTAKTGSKPRRLGKRGGVGAGRNLQQITVVFILIRATVRTQRLDPTMLLEFQMGPSLIKFGEIFSRERQARPVPIQPFLSFGGSATGTFVPVLRA